MLIPLQQLFPEQVLLLLTQDNVDIACQVIEKTAMDRAVVEIDEALASAHEARRAHAEVCFINLCHGTRSLIPDSIGWASRSGTQVLLDPISLRHSPKP